VGNAARMRQMRNPYKYVIIRELPPEEEAYMR
jgi:hypothetical protein